MGIPRHILLFVLFVSIWSSCSKDNKNNNPLNTVNSDSIALGTIEADLNGVKTIFSYNCHADTSLGADGPYWTYSILITGSDNPKNINPDVKSIQLHLLKEPAELVGLKNFTVRDMPVFGYNNNDTDLLTGIYYDTASMHLYNYDTSTKQFVDTFETANLLYSDYGSGYNFPPISITYINDSVIKGTFSGNIMIVTGTGNENPQKIEVTNGKFYVPFKL